jgi:glucose/arabinose dehydrogenase
MAPFTGRVLALATLAALAGCAHQPVVLSPAQQTIVDRSTMEYPPGFVVRPFIVNLTAPTAICFDEQGTLFVAEGGGTINNHDPHIFGYRPATRQLFDIYPSKQQIPLVHTGLRIYGPIGGMVAANGKLFVTHEDADGNGVVTAFNYDGSSTPVVANIPAGGDFHMGDISLDEGGRLYFSVGAATNSGVVGLDNWDVGWPRTRPDVCDVPYLPMKLQGYRFNSDNPLAGLFSGADIAVTGPYQPFDIADNLHIPAAFDGKPTGAIYSISQTGGDLRVEAWGVREPRGIVCGDFHRIYFTDDGMEPRGTRPVLNDPDAVYQLVSRGRMGAWFGWPDYSRALEPIGQDKYQPPSELMRGTGYDEISALIDESTTGLTAPDKYNWLKGVFLPQSGAAKLDIIPSSGRFQDYRGGIVVALFGDRAPFSTGGPGSGLTLKRITGYKVVRVDLLTHEVTDFVYNTRLAPASTLGISGRGLERPIDVKFGPDGDLYILDYGQMAMKHGQEQVNAGSGTIWRLVPAN